MFRPWLIALVFTIAAASTSSADAAADTPSRHHTVVQHVYTYEPAPNPYYGPYYAPGYAPVYVPVAPVTSLPGAAVCLAFSLIGAC